VREVDTLLVEMIRQKPREAMRDAVKKLRKVMMPLLIIYAAASICICERRGGRRSRKEDFIGTKRV